MIQMEEVVMSTTMIEHQALTTADRCDRCGAQAYVRITLRNGGELLFCAHHARAHEDKLKQVALHIQDDTTKIPDKGQYHCPSCMKRFEDAMWVATHEDLRPDPVLKEQVTGDDGRLITFIRFFPDASNLMPDGTVKDAMGSICTQMACPHCRLVLPPGYLLTKNEVMNLNKGKKIELFAKFQFVF